MSWKVCVGEFACWARGYDGPRFHAVLSDPPYGLRFMGKDWDRVSAKDWGEAMMPLLYPGAIVLMFGGTRTWHKLATGMEEAGFEIWDTLMWLHGQGFPKAQAIDKLIDKQMGNERVVVGANPNARPNSDASAKVNPAGICGSGKGSDHSTQTTKSQSEISVSWSGHKTAALKPAWEPILCFRAPRQGKNYAELALEYGSGALNVDGGRISIRNDEREEINNRSGRGFGTIQCEFAGRAEGKFKSHESGRYPANLVLDEKSAEMLDEQAGEVSKGTMGARHTGKHDNLSYGFKEFGRGTGFGDKGGPSRFFYCAKASRSEREQGLSERDDGKPPNNHPTVKPVVLTEWLATLLLPPDSIKPRRLLVPFSGSGSEMIGAVWAGWDEVVGVEQDAGYSVVAVRRLEYWGEKAHA